MRHMSANITKVLPLLLEKVACKWLPLTDSEPPVLPPKTKSGRE